MGVHHVRQPLLEIEEDSNTMSFQQIPRMTITTSPIQMENTQTHEKLPTLTTPPQTVSRSHALSIAVIEQGTHQQTKKLKKSKSTTLLSPLFSSPPLTKLMKTSSLPPPPALPKFVSSSSTSLKTQKPSTKKERSQEDIDELNRQVPPPELMPEVIDTSTDFTKKPLYSYAMLIGMSILRAPNRRLTLSQIYNWISDTFRYYKKGDVGWQNSVRHNLSLNKLFVKSARSKDRKGHFWHILKGYEYQFYLGKSAGTLPVAKAETYKPVPQSYQDKQADSYRDQSFSSNNDDLYSSNEEKDNDGDETVRIINNRNAKTPRSKVIGRGDLDEYSTRESSSLLQRYTLHKRRASEENQYDEYFDTLQPPNKARHLGPGSTPIQSLSVIPKLQPPSPYWTASASGDKVIFGLLRTPPKMMHPQGVYQNSTLAASSNSSTTLANTSVDLSSIFDSPSQLLSGHLQMINQGSRYQQFTSSFSCTSNFDLSPIKGTETGPLLEPLTPGQGLSLGGPLSSTNHHHSTSQHEGNQSNNVVPSTPSLLKTPFNNKIGGFNFTNNGNLSAGVMRTPGSSVMKKIWNSPSYLDDFYTSPVVHRGLPFEEEEVVVSSTRVYGSPIKDRKEKK